EPEAAEPGERSSLVAVGGEAGQPLKRVTPARVCRAEGQPETDVGTLEDAVLGVGEELLQRCAGVLVGEGEGGGEVVEQRLADRVGLDGGKQLAHDRSFSRRSNSA